MDQDALFLHTICFTFRSNYSHVYKVWIQTQNTFATNRISSLYLQTTCRGDAVFLTVLMP